MISDIVVAAFIVGATIGLLLAVLVMYVVYVLPLAIRVDELEGNR